MQNITTLLFDCDNTLVLSEDLAFEGCADLINEICQAKNVKLDKPFTGETLIVEFVGQNFRGMITSLQQRYGFQLTPEEVDSYANREMEVVIDKLRKFGKPCVGVDEQLEALAKSRKYELAVVSSSAMPRVIASIEKTGQDKYFGSRIYSAASSLNPPTTKPNPAIYLYAMKDLGKKPDECVAIEDSKSGSTAAVRANIKTIGYIGPYAAEQKDQMRKTLTEAGCCIIMEDWSEFPECMKKIEAGSI